jgi:hypothetical protein
LLLYLQELLPHMSCSRSGLRGGEPSNHTSTLARANGLFVWLIGHQPAVLFSRNKSAIRNQPAVLFSQNKPAPVIIPQPNEQAEKCNWRKDTCRFQPGHISDSVCQWPHLRQCLSMLFSTCCVLEVI